MHREGMDRGLAVSPACIALLCRCGAPVPRQLKTQATAQPDQQDGAKGAVAIARRKNVQTQQMPGPKPKQRPTQKTNGIGDTFYPQRSLIHAGAFTINGCCAA